MKTLIIWLWAIAMIASSSPAGAQASKTNWQAEWERLIAAGKKEGKVVVSVPARAELRRSIEQGFQQKYGIETEIITGRGASIVRRIADETKAKIHHFDVHIGGSLSFVTALLDEDVLEPFQPAFVLPAVQDPKQWWGGHMWVDNASRYIYAFQAYLTESMWYNPDLATPNELRSYDDFLNAKWKAKIGFLDPRTPGAGDSNWTYMWMVKGEDYLKKLAMQSVFLGRDQRLLAENLAKGRIAIVIGLTEYSFLPFIKAGLPVKPIPPLKEGTYGTGGSGNVAMVKDHPHPNATKVFINWLLNKEGQEVFTKAMGQATRRLDVDTRWLNNTGVTPAKDKLTLQQYLQVENQSEDKLQKVRAPASALAHKLFD